MKRNAEVAKYADDQLAKTNFLPMSSAKKHLFLFSVQVTYVLENTFIVFSQ